MRVVHERTLACRRAAERYKPEADQVLKEEISDNNTHIVFEICKDGLNDEDGRIIEEHIGQEFTVYAADRGDAIEITGDSYNWGEFVVEPKTSNGLADDGR